MKLKVFTSENRKTYDFAIQDVTAQFGKYSKDNLLNPDSIISFSPSVVEDEFGFKVSLWVLLK